MDERQPHVEMWRRLYIHKRRLDILYEDVDTDEQWDPLFKCGQNVRNSLQLFLEETREWRGDMDIEPVITIYPESIPWVVLHELLSKIHDETSYLIADACDEQFKRECGEGALKFLEKLHATLSFHLVVLPVLYAFVFLICSFAVVYLCLRAK